MTCNKVLGLAVCFFVACIPTITAAATVVRIGPMVNGYDWRTHCTLRLEGPIQEGDADLLKRALSQHDTEILCLSSPGGSYNEGLRIADILLDRGIGTVIPAQAECYSACAIIFLAGAEETEIGITTSRFLHMTGRVGFHAPYLTTSQKADEDTLTKAFQAATTAIGKLLSLAKKSTALEKDAIFPQSLLAEMLMAGPTELFQIDTVRKAIDFKVSVIGIAEPHEITAAMICTACENMNPFGPCKPGQSVQVRTVDGAREFSAALQGAEYSTNTCTVTVGRVGSAIGDPGPLYLNYTLNHTGGEMGLWHLYPGDKLLSTLPKASEH